MARRLSNLIVYFCAKVRCSSGSSEATEPGVAAISVPAQRFGELEGRIVDAVGVAAARASELLAT